MSSVVMKKGSEVEMPNREQVVKSIEWHLNQSVNCNGCSYDDGGGCLDTLLKDVITLLKEEEKGMREPTFTNEIAACEATTAKTCGYKCVPMWVKDQRPSNYIVGRIVGKCPSCGEYLSIDPKRFPKWISYCNYCGQGIWWENPDNKRVKIDENKPDSE